MGIAWGSPPQLGCILLHKFGIKTKWITMLCTSGAVGKSMCCVCHFVAHTLGYFGPMFLSNHNLKMQGIRKLGRKSILLQKCMSNRLERMREKHEPTTKAMPNVWESTCRCKNLTTKCFWILTWYVKTIKNRPSTKSYVQDLFLL